MNVRLHIERLVLDGLALERGHEPVLRAALEAELTRLIADGGGAHELMTAGAVPRVSAPGIETAGDGDPAQLGRQIARSVYDSFGGRR
jgi:hypothetical protein